MYIRKLTCKMQKLQKNIKKLFKELYDEYKDIFSVDSIDKGKTPWLEMEIDTGDSQPIIQNPYSLPLKHAA